MLIEFLAANCVCIFIYCFKFEPVSSSAESLLLNEDEKEGEENDFLSQKGKNL